MFFFAKVGLMTMKWRSFQHKNYRLWYMGQLISVIGTWMQNSAQGFLIYELTKSPAYLGFVGLSAGIPVWPLMLYGGVLADRVCRRKMLLATQILMMLISLILFGLTYWGHIEPWHILVLAFCFGICNAFDAPARQSFLSQMVPKSDLGNAIALNSTLFNFAAVVGPAIGGILYAALGPSWCFGINAISFGAIIWALLLMKLTPLPIKLRNQSQWKEMTDGVKYAFHHKVIFKTLLFSSFISIFAMAFVHILPAWAVSVLGGSAITNGHLLSARALGALGGAIFMAGVGAKVGFRFMVIGPILYPVFLLVFGLSQNVLLSGLTLSVVGFLLMVLYNLCNTSIQMEVQDDYRGRVMGLYTLTFFGGTPIGALMMGISAEEMGLRNSMVSLSLICLLCGVYFSFSFLERQKKEKLKSENAAL
jgi:MFS family permease